jgi:small subunit ribosomal protein S17
MADEERQENENEQPEAEAADQAEEAPAAEEPRAEEALEEEAPAEVDAPAEDAPAEEPAAEEAPAEEAPAEEDAAEEQAPAADAPDVEAEQLDMHPKAVRKRERAQAPAEARPERGPEERAAVREERRRGAAARRRRYREGRRAKRGEPGSGTPPAEREPVARRVRQGTVVSSKGDKSITVKVELVGRHRRYEKVVRRTRTLHVHDEGNQAGEGDIVRVVETRPLSRTKRWRLVEILERAR